MNEMEITKISPEISVRGEAKTLSVEGSGFVKTPGLKCYYGDWMNPLVTTLVSDKEIHCELPKSLSMKTGESDVIVSFGKDKVHQEKALRVKHHIGLRLPKVGYHFLSYIMLVSYFNVKILYLYR